MVQYWLVKTEPNCFSIDDLMNSPQKTTSWDGVRNYQARNMLRDLMRKGDKVLFYHSVTGVGVAGLAEVASEAYPDATQWDPTHMHFDPASPADTPRWFARDIRFVEKFSEVIPLAELRQHPALAKMELLKKGSRLSVQPVREEEFLYIVQLAKKV